MTVKPDSGTTSAAASAAAPPSRALLLAAYAAVYFVWGSTYLAIRYAVETLPPFLMAGVRFLIAGAILYGWARSRGAARPGGARWASAAVVGGLLFLPNGAISWAEQWVPSGVTSLLVATVPFWFALLDWLRPGGVRPRPGVIAGLVAGFAATAVLAGPGDPAGEGRLELAAVGAILLGCVSWSVGSLYAARGRGSGGPPALVAGMQMLAGGAWLTAVGLATEWGNVDVRRFSLGSTAAFGYLIVFGSIVAFSAYSWLLRVEPPARVATYAFVNPVVAVLLGWAVKGEPVTGPMLAAAAVVVGSVALITASKQSPPVTGKATGGFVPPPAGPATDAEPA